MPRYRFLGNIAESVFIQNTEIYLNPDSVIDIFSEIADLPYFKRLISLKILVLEEDKTNPEKNPDPKKTEEAQPPVALAESNQQNPEVIK